MKILFLCLGNICRSPMIEAVFYELINKHGLAEKIAVDSAGIADWHEGKRPHQGTLDILDENQIAHKWMHSRPINESDWENFDYIVAMDDQNIEDLRARMPEDAKAKILKAADFISDDSVTFVPDPYYTGDFDETFRLVTEASNRLLAYIEEKHQL